MNQEEEIKKYYNEEIKREVKTREKEEKRIESEVKIDESSIDTRDMFIYGKKEFVFRKGCTDHESFKSIGTS